MIVKSSRYFLDVCGGTGGVCRGIRQRGFTCYLLDTLYGKSGDITSAWRRKRIKRDIELDKIAGGMLAPPCGSFSVNMSRSCTCRSAALPWGQISRRASPRRFA